MHERISMQLFKKLGLVAPREIFARLFINNTYSGLYAIVESVDKHFAGNRSAPIPDISTSTTTT